MESWILSQGMRRIIRLGDRFQKLAPNGDRVPMTPIEFSLDVRAGQIAKNYMPRLIILPNDIDNSVTAIAEIWQGTWVVKCPWSGVAHAGLGLEDGDPENPLFMCCSCWNQLVGGRAILAEYPANWREIEAELMKRPDGRTRGWLQGETLTHLRAETKLRLAESVVS